MPYHTTAVTQRDLCVQLGMQLSGLSAGFVGTKDPATGILTQNRCDSAAATAATLTLGQAVRLRNTAGPLNFTPAHF